METIYLDCAASAPVAPEVSRRIAEAERDLCGNAASVHASGVKASRAVEKSRMIIANRLGVSPGELYFTSGGTEANNWVLKGAVWASRKPRKHLVLSAIEHPSVLEVADWLERTGQAEVTRVAPDESGVVQPAAIERALSADTVLVSVMQVNNETGVIQPLEDIGQICRSRDVWFHSDACQGFLKERLEPRAQGLDFVTLNAHKIHGPKGVGALYIRSGIELTPLLHGGGHEEGRRSGTLNVPGIAGFGEAVARYADADVKRMRALVDAWIENMRREVAGFEVHGGEAPRTCNIVNFSIAGLSGKDIFQYLDREGVRLSTSSACHSTQLTPSHVLKAMGFSDEKANGAVRISIGKHTVKSELEKVSAHLIYLSKSGAR